MGVGGKEEKSETNGGTTYSGETPCAKTSCGDSKLNGTGATCPAFVSAVGRVNARFPSMAIEKEFIKAT